MIPAPTRTPPAVSIWLWAVAFLIFCLFPGWSSITVFEVETSESVLEPLFFFAAAAGAGVTTGAVSGVVSSVSTSVMAGHPRALA